MPTAINVYIAKIDYYKQMESIPLISPYMQNIEKQIRIFFDVSGIFSWSVSKKNF